MPIDLAAHDCEAQALSRLPSYMQRTAWRQLVSAIATEVQEVDDALVAIHAQLHPDAAADAMLDIHGGNVLQPRAGMLDAAYRIAIRGRVAIHRSLALTEDVIRVARLVLNTAAITVTVDDRAPAAIALVLGGAVGVTDDQADAVTGAVRSSVAGGVRVVVESSTVPDADTFAFLDAASGKGFAGTYPTLSMGFMGSGYNGIVGYRAFGAAAAGVYTIAFVHSAGAPNAGILDETNPAVIVYTFKGGTTTSDNFEAAVAASEYLFLHTPDALVGFNSGPLPGGDEFTATPFTGSTGDGGVFATAQE